MSTIPSIDRTEMRKKSCARLIEKHLCYGSGAQYKFSRLHLPVLSDYNVGYNYAPTRHIVGTSQPAVGTVDEAIENVRIAAKTDPRLRIVSIYGPGDPLATDVTFKTLQFVQDEYPYITRCVGTNGLLLPKKVEDLQDSGVAALTLTINAIDPDIGSQIYSYVRQNGETLRGKEAFEELSINQLEGLQRAADAGMMVKVKSVYIPGVNSEHLIDVAKIVRRLGAYIMNITPVVPQGKFANTPMPSLQEVQDLRNICSNIIYQFHTCEHCGADVIDVPD
jgi:nitrogen fixation protein NifB